MATLGLGAEASHTGPERDAKQGQLSIGNVRDTFTGSGPNLFGGSGSTGASPQNRPHEMRKPKSCATRWTPFATRRCVERSLASNSPGCYVQRISTDKVYSFWTREQTSTRALGEESSLKVAVRRTKRSNIKTGRTLSLCQRRLAVRGYALLRDSPAPFV